MREGGRRGQKEGEGKMKDAEQKKKNRMTERAFVPVECLRCLESRCRCREKKISL